MINTMKKKIVFIANERTQHDLDEIMADGRFDTKTEAIKHSIKESSRTSRQLKAILRFVRENKEGIDDDIRNSDEAVRRKLLALLQDDN
jgi:uncharacterized membrane-anchored protein YjiN (DUF445 family)